MALAASDLPITEFSSSIKVWTEVFCMDLSYICKDDIASKPTFRALYGCVWNAVDWVRLLTIV